MNIGFDAKRLFNNQTGLGNYGRQLINAFENLNSEHNLVLYTPKIKLKNFKVKSNTILVEPNTWFSKKMNGFWRLFLVGFLLKKNDVKLFHGLTNELPFFINKTKVKTVVTIHDLIFLRYPQYYNFIDKLIYTYKFKRACKIADRVLAISHQTKSDIIKFFNIEPNKIEVIPLSYNPVFEKEFTETEINLVKEKYKLNAEFFLCVGTIENRKNHQRIVEAFEQLNVKNLCLIFIGNASSDYAKKLKNYCITKQLNVQFLRVESNEELAVFYKTCKALIYVSEFEGFGMPPLEAMVSGCAVIASNTSSIPEVCGKAALYVEPTNTQEIKNAMLKMLNEPEFVEELKVLNQLELPRFNQNNLAKRYLAVYDELVQD